MYMCYSNAAPFLALLLFTLFQIVHILMVFFHTPS